MKSYPRLVQQYGVLDRIFPPFATSASGNAGVRMRTAGLVTRWRARIGSLFAAGWRRGRQSDPAGVGDLRQLQYVRNCAPSLVPCLPKTAHCGLFFCPHCYGRQLAGLHRKVRPYFDSSLRHPSRRRGDFWLVTARRTVVHKHLPDDVQRRHPMFVQWREDRALSDEHVSRLDWLTFLLDAWLPSRKGKIATVPYDGAIVWYVVGPRKTTWALQERYLFLLPVRRTVPDDFLEGAEVRYFPQPSKAEVVRQTARIFSYPKIWLTGPAPVMIDYLHAVFGRHMVASYGGCRKPRRRRRRCRS